MRVLNSLLKVLTPYSYHSNDLFSHWDTLHVFLSFPTFPFHFFSPHLPAFLSPYLILSPPLPLPSPFLWDLILPLFSYPRDYLDHSLFRASLIYQKVSIFPLPFCRKKCVFQHRLSLLTNKYIYLFASTHNFCVLLFLAWFQSSRRDRLNDRAFINTFSLPPFSLPSIYCYFIAFINPLSLLLIPSRFYLKRFWISCCDLILFGKLQPVWLKISFKI